ncbi:ankyrin repeat protein [Trematosphaeria pertusa]|uniref:Ankyrin repeat protein n=1 Tax=Trematosphaeria pertusa TaxID=390896 RepID=A0A6A6IIZ2_9PLEO|nr:ankyrin repeat protein [Trematosphaeria pertusa]KAF2250189.1 ankyrin repeat protein [Trematosphaeria pertusa]
MGADKEAKSSSGQTPLHLAAKSLSLCEEVVRVLINIGADKEAKDEDYQTPLHLAAKTGLWVIVRALIEHGADKEAKDSNDQTPLQLANAKQHVAVVQLLSSKP